MIQLYGPRSPTPFAIHARSRLPNLGRPYHKGSFYRTAYLVASFRKDRLVSDGLCRCVAPKETSLAPKATSQRAKTMPSGAFVTSSEAICAQNDFIKMALLFHHYHRQRATYVLGMGASALGRQTTSIARKLIQ